MKIMNNEPKKSRKVGTDCASASVVPMGRTCFEAEFPGTSSLVNIRGRFATLHNREGDVGEGGKRRLGRRGFTALSGWEIGKTWNFYRLATGFYRIATASCRLVTGFYRLATGCYRIISEFYRVLPRKSTQVVDFPRMAMVGLFWEGAGNSLISGRGMIGRGMGNKPWSQPSGAWNQYLEAEVI
jgi:hypothetical protein